ncbi:uncharacterized protein LOC122857511 isoform X2 [Aphidius gifuensis]|uniref:uncharacterized protein LOC122857511 isoform X2 n=1 Tax=Aphidius gifuensis TaxID=684658 RepID=UPI001CDC6382|nr:uncharacterized protein LOC122857511 isoform X2 [Aphidius gifuensis]
MQTADRCLVKNLTTGHNLIVYSHNVYCKNSDGIVRVATEKDITSSNASLFFKSGADEIPITMITYKHTKGDILRTNRESLGRSKRIQIRKRLSLTPIKPLAAMNRRKNLDEDKSLKWIVSRIEDEEVMAVLQNHSNNVNCGGEQTELALKIRKCLNKQNKAGHYTMT